MRYGDDYGAAWDAEAGLHAMTAILNRGDGTETPEAEFKAAGKRDAQILLPYLPEGGSALDYGCGIGRLLRAVSTERPEAELVGLDVSEEMLRQLPGYCEDTSRITTHLVSGTGLFDMGEARFDMGEARFDLIWSWLVLQHMETYDVFRFLVSCHRSLKPRGCLVATFPRVDSPEYGRIYWNELRSTASGAGRMRLYTPDHVTFMLNEAGLAVQFLGRGSNLVVRGVKA